MSPQTPFEDVLDAGRRDPDDEAATRRAAMVRTNDREAAIEWQLLNDFDEQRDEPLAPEKIDALAKGVLARLMEPEPEIAESTEPEPEIAAATGRREPEPEIAAAERGEPEPEIATMASSEATGPRRFYLAQSTTRRFAVAVGAVQSRWRKGLAAAAVIGLSLAGGWYGRGYRDEHVVATVALEPSGSPTTEVGAVEPPVEDEASAPARHASPGVLLSRAERAKGLGRPRRAAALYRRVLRGAPRSPEAEMARLGLARVLLEELDAPESALDHFDAYLRDYPDGLLRPEARLGRAQALGRAGRVAEERRAWRDVLDADPDGAAADLARHAIEAELP